MALLQGVLNRLYAVSMCPFALCSASYLEDSLILLAVCVVCLLRRLHIVFQVRDRMLVRL